MMDFTTPAKKRPKQPPRPSRNWLDDPGLVSHQRASRPPEAKPRPVKSPRRGKVSVDIQFTKPEFHRLKATVRWVRERVTKRQVITVAVIIIVIAGSWAALIIHKHQLDRRAALHPAQSLANPGTTGTLDLPSFVPAVPGTKQDLLTPDGVHSSYDKSKASYGYVDSINGQQFTVSEQQLTSSQGSGQTAINKVATSLKATIPLKTGWGTAYVLTNKKYNSQTLVFGVRDLLVFVQASFTLTNDQWVTYINNLE